MFGGYVATDMGENVIYGSGPTIEEAIADALAEGGGAAEDYKTFPATTGLMGAIADLGGDQVEWQVVGGYAHLRGTSAPEHGPYAQYMDGYEHDPEVDPSWVETYGLLPGTADQYGWYRVV